MKSVLITGVSSGIGLGLANQYLRQGCTVYGASRRIPEKLQGDFHHVVCDLAKFEQIPGKLAILLREVTKLDLVILNAGAINRFGDMAETSIDSLKSIMDINVWSNKVVLDWLFAELEQVDQAVAISSGAAVNGNRGWNGYSISKAALNMLITLYSREQPDCHFTAFAPGLVDTPIQDYLCGEASDDRFPALEGLKKARGTDRMPSPDEFGEIAVPILEKLRMGESGQFIDIRRM